MTDNISASSSTSTGDAAWSEQPDSSHWTTAANWNPAQLPKLGSFTADQLTAASVGNATASFSIVGDELRVTFNSPDGAPV